MFTPLNQKKLVNVSVVTLKKFGKRYELAVYPNKLYEYQRGITSSLSEILQTDTIYRNVSKGEIVSHTDLNLFGKTHVEIVKEILENGHEQKNRATRAYEQELTERDILNVLKKKVTKDGRYLNENALKEAIYKVHRIHTGDSKKQSQEILNKLEMAGFDRVGVKIKVEVDARIEEFVNEHGRVCDGCVIVKSDRFPEFRELCSKSNVRYSIVRTEEVSDEEIC